MRVHECFISSTIVIDVNRLVPAVWIISKFGLHCLSATWARQTAEPFDFLQFTVKKQSFSSLPVLPRYRVALSYLTYRSYPSDDEIATRTGFTIARVKHLKTLEYSMSSLDSKVSEDMDGTLLDTIQDDTISDPILNISIKEHKTAINKALSQLSKREQKVLILRFGLCGPEKHSLEETGRELNLTIERISQIESLALNKIRSISGTNTLRKFIKL